MDSSVYDCDGLQLALGSILEPFDASFLEPEAQFLSIAPLWRVELDKDGNWRTQPQQGGEFYPLTQDIASCCRSWPNPVTDICDPTGRQFPPDTPPEHRFYAI